VAVKDGIDIWKEILGDTTFSAIPLVLISLSEDEQNVLMRDHAANDIKPVCYIYKPIDLNQLLTTVNKIDGFGVALTKLN
jgi:CheY-like chemotaxis protein